MPSGKNHKKSKHTQALLARSGEITDDYQRPSGSTGDPSRSRITDPGDDFFNRTGSASDNQLAVPGNHRDLPSPAPAGQISHDDFASTLSAISPLQSGIDTMCGTGGNAEQVGRATPPDSICASRQQDSRAATSWHSGSSPEFVHSVIPPSPKPTNQSRTVSTRNSESSCLPPSSSPYPMSKHVSNGAKGNSSAITLNLFESVEMRIAAACSLAERPEVSDARSNPRPNNWDDINLRIAADALAHKRGENKSNSVYQRRVAAWKRNERQLCIGREADDFTLAEELQAREVVRV
ncbi:hypothetical protein B0H17DRAFT_1138649 [Mycena rosella]|uniref:Uncharacterized protein n=1 Tax=Mycena rosella TaxID=1033263 RepID=A0AAD7D7I4_MYCRO|nr:hypothetical protein B0H17DRAFT_1138649 [Mycena rosella]